jgi:cholesterol oxidase
MLEDPVHAAGIVGSVRADLLSRAPMTIANGRFNLFVDEGTRRKRMRYRGELASVEGRRYFFDGYKMLDGASGGGLWRDTTTLLVSVHEGSDEHGAVAARGIVRISGQSFLKELLYMKGSTGRGGASLHALALYGAMFGKGLWDVYRPRAFRG